MASSKNGSVLSKKRAPNDATVSSPVSDNLTQDGRKRRKKHNLSSLGVTVDSTILSAPDQYKKSPGPVAGSGDPPTKTRTRQGDSQEQAALRLEKMQGAVRTLLECIGEDPGRDGLLDTPSRYAKALLFLTKGYHANVEDIVNNALFHEGHNEMVIVRDIDIFSLCEHHLVPFTGKESSPFPRCMHIGYIPSNTVIGLSKLPRVAEIFSRRLQIQERLTKQVAHAIMDILKPQGVAVVMESSHLCMVMRGVEKTGATTLTSCMLGCFEQKSKTRNEFMHYVGVNR
ncbi:GTP cyclohydrolase I [Fusarium oxysporum f. sp. raphani 54005]|uniref:GTP cyclohydrolase 1 n=1 Tax=Fusarium oxysporum f. sp. raphani 54005 TaxID=1089458 RepID=X0B2A1_FUSOX|nr:GTP cyclohydrolase I [Fusarium oxysporum f. sp. raphani 54005]